MKQQFHIKTTKYHRALNFLCLAALIGTAVFLFINWENLPEKLPAHFNAAGEIDRWGGKRAIWITFALNAVIYTGLTILEQFPQVWNTGVAITEKNREKVYAELKNLLVTIKCSAIMVLSCLIICTCSVQPLPIWFLPASMGLLFGPMVYFLSRIYKAKE